MFGRGKPERPVRDWAWVPPAWSRRLDRPEGRIAAPSGVILPGLSLHHDSRGSGVGWSQSPGLALTLDPGAFAGTFVSLALDLPAGHAAGLTRESVLSLECAAGTRPAARVMLSSGQFIAGIWFLSMPGGGLACELAGSELDPAIAGKAWFDLIFTPPFPAPPVLAGLTFRHRRRAGF
jgi:hypothetical protein